MSIEAQITVTLADGPGPSVKDLTGQENRRDSDGC